MKTFFKSIRRMIFSQITRLLTITSIIFVSVSLMFGISEVRNRVDTGIEQVYSGYHLPDINIKSTSQFGLLPDSITKLKAEFGEDNVKTAMIFDQENTDGLLFRLLSYEFDSGLFNLTLIDGKLPESPNEILLQYQSPEGENYSVGDEISIQNESYNQTYKVSGIVENPFYFAKRNEPSQLEGKTLDGIIYLNFPVMLTTDAFITLSGNEKINIYSESYQKLIDSLKETITNLNIQSDIITLTLYENFGLFSAHAYAEKVEKIAIIFIVFFMLVTILVIFSTITRLLDEERPQIACLKTLGYSNFACHLKYFIFVIVAVFLGSALAALAGGFITKIIYSAFNIQFHLPAFPENLSLGYFTISVVIILVSSLVSTYASATKMTSALPAKLLTPKSPKKGKKVLLEKIPFIWNRLSFKYKSTLRNVFLFKSRFFMTVISIIGSTILVLAGLGLLDNAKALPDTESIIIIAIVLIIFAALLCALVIYNITNINISERSREISSLMVLGYFDNEVTSYIFREIYIMSFIGALLGVPIGYFFLDFVFNFISFGSVATVNWWSWILAPVITIIFTVLSTFLLYRKIIKTDISVSLKTLD